MSDQPRPVWLTREQRETLNQYALDLLSYGPIRARRRVEVADAVSDVVDAWDAAPADATAAAAERVRVELVCALRSPDARSHEPDLAAAHRDICAVLRALEMP